MRGVARTPCWLLVTQGSSLNLGVHCPENYQNSQVGTHIHSTLATERGPLESLQLPSTLVRVRYCKHTGLSSHDWPPASNSQ